MNTPAMVLGKVAFMLILMVMLTAYMILPVTGYVENETANKTAGIFGASALSSASKTSNENFKNVVTAMPYAFIIGSIMFIIVYYIKRESQKNMRAREARRPWYITKKY